MVEIPVEKKSRGPAWWVWVLVALVLAALAWFLLARDGRVGPVAQQQTGQQTRTTAVDDGPITRLDRLTGDPSGLIGRQVVLDNVEVLSADERGGLIVSDGSGQLFVSTSTPSAFTAGNRVDIEGRVAAADAATAGRAGPPAGLPTGATHYIEARTIQPA